MKMTTTTIITIMLVVAVGAGGFFAGMKYQQSKSPSFRQFGAAGARNGGNGTGNNRMGMRPVSGEIISSDSSSITVKLTDGSSKIILVSDKTMINKATAGTKNDLAIGTKIAAFGTENSDGSISASNIQLNPASALSNSNPNKGQKSSDAREIVVEASNYKFSPNTISVKKGEKVRIVLKDIEGTHDFRIDELSVATAMIQTGQQDFVEFTPDKTGSFQFYCSMGNHRALGMVGTLVVQ